ncbi:MAG: NYN domain-containing protein [Candidatus Andeanibacterium colombiense]|uniref:NYN domain-containing protein n=1 Tax=Candidatus Andeanibacterium colombiense TaxID=3121345 RepID=A0AAJ5X7D4_9SPHN|nr:MAG: NYN domain-containing protein [Sphingomonadaceae bacterium]
MPENALKNIALLIDADNAGAREIDAVLTVLAGLGQVNIRRAYGNWAKVGLKGWSNVLHRYGISPHQQFDLTKGKNATDMAMTIDAMDLLYQGKVDGYGIVSSDSDFTPLAMRLRQDGVLVYGFGRSKTPEAFKTACTRFIEVDSLTETAGDDEGPAVPAKQHPVRKKVDEAVVDELATAWKASKRDERGFASLSEMGKIANNRSSFDVRTYGFKRLSDLIEAAGDQFKVERRDDGVYVRRQR